MYVLFKPFNIGVSMSIITVITSTSKSISYTYNTRSGREVSKDGIKYLVTKMHNVWRVLVPYNKANTYILADKPYVYKVRKDAVHGIMNDDIKVHTQEKVVDMRCTIVMLEPSGTCGLYGHIMVYNNPLTKAFYRKVPKDTWSVSCGNISGAMVDKGYVVTTKVLTVNDCNFKNKVAAFMKYCDTNRVVVE